MSGSGNTSGTPDDVGDVAPTISTTVGSADVLRRAAISRSHAAHTGELVNALRAPSFQQDSAWHHAKADYATKPRELLDEAADKIEGLLCDLQNAVEVAFRRGALDWTRLNYPADYARLMAQHVADRDVGTVNSPPTPSV